MQKHIVIQKMERVLSKAKHVRINQQKLREFAAAFDARKMRHWSRECPIRVTGTGSERLAFLFVFNSISFCYWGNPKWHIGERDEYGRGTWNMVAALQRARHEGVPILDPKYLSRIEPGELGRILKGNTTLSFLGKRSWMLNELGEGVRTYFQGSFDVLSRSGPDSIKLLQTIIAAFPSFADSPLYDGETIPFYKRAQLLVADIHHQFPDLVDCVDQLSACADYVIPMVLRHHGILEYSQELAEYVDEGIWMNRDCVEEIEIRAGTIAAIERVRKELQERIPGITSMDINDYLWLAKKDVPKGTRYHQARTTAY